MLRDKYAERAIMARSTHSLRRSRTSWEKAWYPRFSGLFWGLLGAALQRTTSRWRFSRMCALHRDAECEQIVLATVSMLNK